MASRQQRQDERRQARFERIARLLAVHLGEYATMRAQEETGVKKRPVDGEARNWREVQDAWDHAYDNAWSGELEAIESAAMSLTEGDFS